MLRRYLFERLENGLTKLVLERVNERSVRGLRDPRVCHEPGDVDIETVKWGPGGSLEVTGTIVCEPFADYFIRLEARQTQGNQPVKFGQGSTGFYVDCQTTTSLALEPFTVYVVPGPGSKPFRKGEVVVSGFRDYCSPSFCHDVQIAPEVFDLPR